MYETRVVDGRIIHEPVLPVEADIERLAELFGEATTELEGVNFRLAAYLEPYSNRLEEEPATALPTFENIGRLSVLVDGLKLDRWTLDGEIRKLEENASLLVELREG